MLAGCLSAEDNQLSSASKKAGWKTLFDGKSLSAWEDPAGRTPPGDSWTIEDGCIKARPGPRIREDLMSKERFTDFELVFEWKIAAGSNSGVKYGIQKAILLDKGRHPKGLKFEKFLHQQMLQPAPERNQLQGQGEEYAVGFEYQIIDDSRHADAQRGAKYQAGALYSLIGASARSAKSVGEFNQGRIIKRGNHVEHWLNGVKVVDGYLDSEEVKSSLAGRWTSSHPVYRLLTRPPHAAAPIGIQNHNDVAWFRNIRIRPLP
jgi:hypothetical protein